MEGYYILYIYYVLLKYKNKCQKSHLNHHHSLVVFFFFLQLLWHNTVRHLEFKWQISHFSSMHSFSAFRKKKNPMSLDLRTKEKALISNAGMDIDTRCRYKYASTVASLISTHEKRPVSCSAHTSWCPKALNGRLQTAACSVSSSFLSPLWEWRWVWWLISSAWRAAVTATMSGS